MGINFAKEFFPGSRRRQFTPTYAFLIFPFQSVEMGGGHWAGLDVRQAVVFSLLHLSPERGGNFCRCSPREQGESTFLTESLNSVSTKACAQVKCWLSEIRH